MKVLFVCSRNRRRSLTAEAHFDGRDGHVARSAGTSDSARVRVTEGHLRWADLVVVMEKKHRDQLRARFGAALDGVRIACLHLPDRYEYDDPRLVARLERDVPPLLVEPPGDAAPPET